MATPEETAAVREAFDRLGDVLLRPEHRLMASQGGTVRGRLVLTLHGLIADAHSLASIILDMDRAEQEKVPDGPLCW